MANTGPLSLVMKCEKWIDQHDMTLGQRKKSEFPTGIEPVISPEHQAGALSTEVRQLMESKVISFVTCVLYTTRISIAKVAQWINKHPPGVWEVMGLIPVGDSEFFFVSHLCHVDQFTSHSLIVLLDTLIDYIAKPTNLCINFLSLKLQ